MILLLIFRVLCRAVNLSWLPGLCNTPKVSFIFCTLLKASRLRWCSPVKHLALSRRRSRVQWNTRFALGPNKSRPEHFRNNIVSSSTSQRTASFRNKEARDGAPACCNTLLCAATKNCSNGQMLNRTTLITTPMTIPHHNYYHLVLLKQTYEMIFGISLKVTFSHTRQQRLYRAG